MQLLVNTNFDFVGKRRWFYAASGIAIVVSVLTILVHGLNYGIDFTGGALVQVRYERPVAVGDVRRGLETIKLGSAIIQQFGDPQEYLIRLPQEAGVKAEQVGPQVQEALTKTSGMKVEMRRVEFVGPQVGRDLQVQALYAVLAGMAGILIYVAIRFDFRGGVISIACIAHDVIVTLGALSITNREMSLPVLAALLTIVGYSINDTIVVFDRVRESRGKGLRRGQSLADLVNGAINQTLSRTILTAFTTFMAALVLFVFGGEVLRDLAFALVVGVITGTYSSVAAVSLVMDWESWTRSRQRSPRKVAAKV